MTFDRNQAADAREARLGAFVRRRRAGGCDPVVDDFEVLSRQTPRSRPGTRPALARWRCERAQRADRTVSESEPTPFPELVETVLRREPERHASQRAGELAVDIGVHEVCVEDAGPHRVRDRRRPPPNATGSTSARSLTSSSGTPRARSSSANSHAPGSSSCSMRKRTSQPRSRRSGRSWSRCASEPEMPATFWVWSTTPSVMRYPRRRGCHGPTTAPSGSGLDALAKTSVRSPRDLPGSSRPALGFASAQLSGILAREALFSSRNASKTGLDASTGRHAGAAS